MESHWAGYLKAIGTTPIPTTSHPPVATYKTTDDTKGTTGFLGTWNKEGWTQEGIKAIERFKDGAAAIEFKVID